jgi:hypothetical protein
MRYVVQEFQKLLLVYELLPSNERSNHRVYAIDAMLKYLLSVNPANVTMPPQER